MGRGNALNNKPILTQSRKVAKMQRPQKCGADPFPDHNRGQVWSALNGLICLSSYGGITARATVSARLGYEYEKILAMLNSMEMKSVKFCF